MENQSVPPPSYVVVLEDLRIGLWLFTAVISLPVTALNVYMIKSRFALPTRPSNQMIIYPMLWCGLYVFGALPYSVYSLCVWWSPKQNYDPILLKWLIALYLAFIIMVPLGMLGVTLDRILSLLRPVFCSMYNQKHFFYAASLAYGLCTAVLVAVFGSFMQVPTYINNFCYVLDCMPDTVMVNMAFLTGYKIIVGTLNVAASIAFILIYVSYKKTRATRQERTKHGIVFVAIVTESVFNILPSILYYFVYINPEFERRAGSFFLLLIFFGMDVDGVLSAINYVVVLRRFQRALEKSGRLWNHNISVSGNWNRIGTTIHVSGKGWGEFKKSPATETA